MRQLLRLSLDENPFQDEELLHRLKTEGALAVCLSAPSEYVYLRIEGEWGGRGERGEGEY